MWLPFAFPRKFRIYAYMSLNIIIIIIKIKYIFHFYIKTRILFLLHI